MNRTVPQRLASVFSVFATIFKVFLIIELVALCLTLFSVAALPKNAISAEVENAVRFELDLRSLLGDDWEEQLENDPGVWGTLEEDGYSMEKTDRGFAFSSDNTMGINTGFIAGLFLPRILTCVCWLIFTSTLKKALLFLKNSPFPFLPEVAVLFRRCAVVLFVTGVAPAFTSFLIETVLAFMGKESTLSSGEIGMEAVLLGCAFLFLESVFRFGSAFMPASFGAGNTPPPPPPGAFSYGTHIPFSPTGSTPPPAQDPAAPKTPSDDDNGIDPNAF